ncbi:hypothetical protein POM88_000783 [Heracleum sosnowskyi]|uniref:Uncharacterized protein n=1 Tax=Heracleum sosnowskyi TaxID=360622 RepID=A0AAD8NB46_9APIA|nr:hypothetical protein POM88_000783 [Heracleum sosnowskyi]
MDLNMCGIEKRLSQLELWWDDRRWDIEDMWARKMLKHSGFSNFDLILVYASMTYLVEKLILKGSEGKLGLKVFLVKKEFLVGKYYHVADLLVALKEYFGVDICPTFVGHGGYHPSLFEVGVIFNKDYTQMIPHPMVTKVPNGQFLLRHI